MKIIHCADLHLDSKMESNLDREAAGMRRDELLDTFERMVAYAAEQNVRVILIAGDLFDKPNVRKTAKTHVIEQIKGASADRFLLYQGQPRSIGFCGRIIRAGGYHQLKTLWYGRMDIL